MSLPRIIPVLLLKNQGLVKSVKFKNHRYIGDPINAVKIFNEKEVDELIFLDIDATKNKSEPNYEYLKEIASECFMPLSYGGGINNVHQIKLLIQSGIEKIIINSEALSNIAFVKQASDQFGASTIIAAIDVKLNFWGKYKVYSHKNRKITKKDPFDLALELQQAGAGEIFINDVDKEGTFTGYNLNLIKSIADRVDIPIVACGGARNIDDLTSIIRQGGVNGAAAGSMFVYHGKHRAVLITYPDQQKIKELINKK